MSKGPSTRVTSATRKGLSIYVGTAMGQYGPRPFYGIQASYFDKEAKEFKRKELLDGDDMAHLMTLIPQAMQATVGLLAKAKEAADSPGSETTTEQTADADPFKGDDVSF